MQHIVGLILLGLAAGALSGVTGLGGAALMIPALIYFFGFSSHMAQGTALAVMIPPIGILAAWTYYEKGFVDIEAAVLVAGGFLIGGLFGAKLGVVLPEDIIRKVFAVVLIAIALKTLFVPKT